MKFFSLPNRGNSFNLFFTIKKQTDKEIFIMDAVYVGWLSILPPMIAIILALITKEVLFSLIAGVFIWNPYLLYRFWYESDCWSRFYCI